MIEFKGYLTGVAEKYFNRKTRMLGGNILLVSLALVCIPLIAFGIKYQNWLIVRICCFGFITVPIMTFIPRGKKEKKSFLPKRIFVEDDCIICVADKYTETKFIEDVKKVFDYGDFYYLSFPMGNISDKFICQKSLLTKGSLEDFESLFEGKIERKINQGTVQKTAGQSGDGSVIDK